MVKILIVDDHALMRRVIREVIEQESDLSVVAEASNGLEAETQAAATRPDVVLMDLDMPGCDGFEATERVLACSPCSQVVIFTASREERHVLQAIQRGAIGYITKDIEPDTLIRAIRCAARNDLCIPGSLATQMLAYLRAIWQPRKSFAASVRSSTIAASYRMPHRLPRRDPTDSAPDAESVDPPSPVESQAAPQPTPAASSLAIPETEAVPPLASAEPPSSMPETQASPEPESDSTEPAPSTAEIQVTQEQIQVEALRERPAAHEGGEPVAETSDAEISPEPSCLPAPSEHAYVIPSYIKRPLTFREQQILDFMRRGYKNREIARELEIAESTVHKHVQNIFEKLHARNRTEAIYLISTDE